MCRRHVTDVDYTNVRIDAILVRQQKHICTAIVAAERAGPSCMHISYCILAHACAASVCRDVLVLYDVHMSTDREQSGMAQIITNKRPPIIVVNVLHTRNTAMYTRTCS